MKRWHLTLILAMLAGAGVTLVGSMPVLTAATVAAVQILAPEDEPAALSAVLPEDMPAEIHSDLVQHQPAPAPVAEPLGAPALPCGGHCPPEPVVTPVRTRPVERPRALPELDAPRTIPEIEAPRTIPELDEPRTIPELDIPPPVVLPPDVIERPSWDGCPACGMG